MTLRLKNHLCDIAPSKRHPSPRIYNSDAMYFNFYVKCTGNNVLAIHYEISFVFQAFYFT